MDIEIHLFPCRTGRDTSPHLSVLGTAVIQHSHCDYGAILILKRNCLFICNIYTSSTYIDLIVLYLYKGRHRLINLAVFRLCGNKEEIVAGLQSHGNSALLASCFCSVGVR